MHLSIQALVNTSVFCADLRLEFGGKTIAGLSTALLKQWDTRPLDCISIRPRSWWGLGDWNTWSLGILSVTRRLTEMCITGSRFWPDCVQKSDKNWDTNIIIVFCNNYSDNCSLKCKGSELAWKLSFFNSRGWPWIFRDDINDQMP